MRLILAAFFALATAAYAASERDIAEWVIRWRGVSLSKAPGTNPQPLANS